MGSQALFDIQNEAASPAQGRESGQDSQELVLESLNRLLRQLTAENFHDVKDQMIFSLTRVLSPCILTDFVSLLFEKAVSEAASVFLIGQLCFELSQELPLFPSDEHCQQEISFKMALLNKCQRQFESMVAGEKERGQLAEGNWALEHEQQRMLGTVRFFGELFKQRMLPVIICHRILLKLFEDIDGERCVRESHVEVICEFLSSVGTGLDCYGTFQQRMAEYFKNLENLSGDVQLPFRLRLKIFNVLELWCNDWVPKHEEVASSVQGKKPREDSEVLILDGLNRLLNRLNHLNFEDVKEQMTESLRRDLSPFVLNDFVSLILEKAVTESASLPLIGRLCSELSQELHPFAFHESHRWQTSFKRVLLDKCQKQFESVVAIGKETGQLAEANQVVAEHEGQRMIGTVRFFGELFKRRMLTEAICHHVILRLFGESNEETWVKERNVEAICELLNSIGKELDHRKRSQPQITAYFNNLEKLSADLQLPFRLRLKIFNVLELQCNNWELKYEKGNTSTANQSRSKAVINCEMTQNDTYERQGARHHDSIWTMQCLSGEDPCSSKIQQDHSENNIHRQLEEAIRELRILRQETSRRHAQQMMSENSVTKASHMVGVLEREHRGELRCRKESEAALDNELEHIKEKEAELENELRHKKEREAELESELEHMKGREAALKNELERRIEREAELENELEDKKLREAFLENKLDLRREREVELENELQHRKEKEAELESELEHMMEREADLKSELEHRMKREAELENELEDRKLREAFLENKLDLRREREVKLENELQHRKEREADLKNEIERRMEKEAKLENEENELEDWKLREAFLENKLDRRREREAELENELQHRKEREAELESELEHTKEREAELENELEDKKLREAFLENKLDLRRKREVELEKELQHRKEREVDLKNGLECRMEREVELENELKDWKLREAFLENKLDLRREREVELENELQHRKEREVQLESELEHMKGREAELESELEHMKGREAELESELEHIKEREAELESELEHMKEKEADLKNELERRMEKEVELENKLEDQKLREAFLENKLDLRREREANLINELENVKQLLEIYNKAKNDLEVERDNALKFTEQLLNKQTNTASSASLFELREEAEPPSRFICPISQEIMRDPHVAMDGFTYEGEAIREWFDTGHGTSPMTSLMLCNLTLVPNLTLRSLIQEWLEQNK